jgi:hypothetical protein
MQLVDILGRSSSDHAYRVEANIEFGAPILEGQQSQDNG